MLNHRTEDVGRDVAPVVSSLMSRSDLRLTIEPLLELANDLVAGVLNSRRTLMEARFVRAGEASAASVRRLDQKLADLLPFLQALPTLDPSAACSLLNEHLTELPISPSLVAHDEWPHHLHWTASTARFDDKVVAEFLMALAMELCVNGTSRFGACAADGCSDLFLDSSRGRSRRFCDDSRCATRTHTANHRARARAAVKPVQE